MERPVLFGAREPDGEPLDFDADTSERARIIDLLDRAVRAAFGTIALRTFFSRLLPLK
jgi:hypothetical protein